MALERRGATEADDDGSTTRGVGTEEAVKALITAATVTLLAAGPLFAQESGGQHQGPPPDAFDVRTELQGLYDEISQATLQFMTESDIDLLHDALYTPDWVFVNETGGKQTWSQMRGLAVHALSEPRPDSMIQAIQKVSLGPDDATVVVDMTTVRTIVDDKGRYGRPGASHTLAETTVLRDSWIRIADEWKLKSREQIGKPTASVDKTEW
jgi:hypothetical protein